MVPIAGMPTAPPMMLRPEKIPVLSVFTGILFSALACRSEIAASARLGSLGWGGRRTEAARALTASILIGSVPGVFIGAQLSSRAPDGVIRPALILVLLGSSLKLLGSSNGVLALVIALFAAAYLAVRASEQRSARLSLKLR